MHLRWTEFAARDLAQVCDFIEEHNSGSTARGVALSIHERINVLVAFPERVRPGRKAGTRELVLTGLRYLAVCRTRQEATEVLRILHGAQEWIE